MGGCACLVTSGKRPGGITGPSSQHRETKARYIEESWPQVSEQKRVAIIGTRGYLSYYGGFETLLRYLVPYLTENGWDVDVYCRKGVESIDARMSEERNDWGVKQVFTWGVESKSLSTLSFGLTSSAHAAWKKPDAALVMNVANGYWLPLLKSRGIPTAVNVDGIEWDRAKWGTVAKKVFLLGARMTAKHATTLVFDANEIGRLWREQFGRDGVFIPYGGSGGVDLPAVPEHPSGTYVLYVARLVPENSVNQFVEAAERISSHADVVIVGSSGYGGPIEDRVRAAASKNPSITWLGHINDDQQLHALWANAGAYFHGHTVGGTNPALVQAMACGAPIVARDTPYNREVLGENSIFTDGEPSEIAQNIMRVITDKSLQARLKTDNMTRQSEKYNWVDVCRQYQNVLERAVTASNDARSAVHIKVAR